MTTYARPLVRLLEALEKLPGVGPRSAERMAFHLLRIPRNEVLRLAQAIAEVQEVLKKHSIEDATIQRPRADLEELFLRTVRESGERPGRRFSTEELAATAGKSDEGDK